MNKVKATKREILISIAIVAVLMAIGFALSSKISNSMMDGFQEYNTALKIDNDKATFQYGMKTNVGNAFVYGELKAIDPVTYDELEGKFSYVKRVTEKYTAHTRMVSTGKGRTMQVYYSWDIVDEDSINSSSISFLGVEFPYGTIKLPEVWIDTVNMDGGMRYQYYATPAECTGTVYGVLKDNTILNSKFYDGQTIESTLKSLESGWQMVGFWIGWAIMIIALVVAFCFFDNKWLEDKKRYAPKTVKETETFKDSSENIMDYQIIRITNAERRSVVHVKIHQNGKRTPRNR